MTDEIKAVDTATANTAPANPSVAKQTTKAIIRPALILGTIMAAIPEPYVNYVYIAWLAIVVACYDLHPPTKGGKWLPVLMIVYRGLNFIACNPDIAVQGLASSGMFKGAAKSIAANNKDNANA